MLCFPIIGKKCCSTIFLASNNTKRESISTIAHKTCQIGLSNSNNTLQSSFKIEYVIIRIQKVTIKVRNMYISGI